MKSIRIGGALGFWGDRNDALLDLLRGGPLDYVIMDYLAEITMSILQKQRLKDPSLGYAHDFVSLVKQALPLLRKNRVRLIADAGGLNPVGCAESLVAMAREAGFPDLKVGVVFGDDLMPHFESFARMGIDFRHFDTGTSQKEIPGKILSANAYFGAFPIAEALQREAEIVVTGRVNDAALVLGPLIHEFGWTPDQHDLLAAGTMAGHLLECGGQASGGNFNGGWQQVPNLADLAFPIGEVSEDGTLVMTIHPGHGGLMTPAVLKEQLLYEIGDPSAYIVADVVSDVTQLEMEDLGANRVRVWGVRGHPPPPTYKVSMSYEGGFQVSVGLVYVWPDCVAKARAGADLFLKRLDKLGIRYRDHRISILGYDGVHGDMSRKLEDPDEVYLRIAFLVESSEIADRISREMVTHILCGIPTACGLEVGRPSPHKQIVYWPSLVPKAAVKPCVDIKS